MKRPAFFADGYTTDGYIAPIPGMVDEPVRFKFRPALVEQGGNIKDAAGDSTAEWNRQAAAVTADHLVSWSIGAEPTAENVQKLHPFVFARLVSIVLGNRASDIDPEWDEQQKRDEQSLAETPNPGEARTERDLGN